MRWLLIALIACKGHESAPSSGSAATPAPIARPALHVHCEPARLPPRPALEPAGAIRPDDGATQNPLRAEPALNVHRPATRDLPDVHVADTHAWTPYAASEALAPADIATVAAKELELAIVTAKVDAKLLACFGVHTGSVRAMLRVAFDGGVIDARAGGLGDRDAETCIAGALVGTKVSAPPIVPEIACDLDRGEPEPWRVTRSADYRELDVTATDILSNGAHAAMNDDEHDAKTTFLVIVPGALPAIRIDQTTMLVLAGSATLVGVELDGGAPVFAGMGLDGRLGHGGEDGIDAGSVMLAIDPSGSPVRACVDGRFIGDAALEPKALDTLFGKLAATCKTRKCSTTIAVGPFGSSRDLAQIAEAAFRAGTPRVLLGSDASCGAQ
jgi:hypothetical protein